MSIILSIHPKWAKLIYEGKKKIEWRKSFPKIDNDTTVFIYETAPIKKITGYFITSETCWLISDIMHNDRAIIEAGCVSREELVKYKGKNECLFGWTVSKPHKANCPMPIADFDMERAPQSWCYTEVDV